MNTPLKILPLTFLLLLLFISTRSAKTFTGKVVRVIDGDTIEILVNKEPIRIRLADIDCPEKKQPFGNAAKKYVLDIAAHEIVAVEARNKDRYGRTIG